MSRTNYVCRSCGLMRLVDDVITAPGESQPRIRRIRCPGRCRGRKGDHLKVTAPDFVNPWNAEEEAHP